MAFRFSGLEPAQFAHLFELSDVELAARGISRVTADSEPGFPCRISLEEATPGELLLLLSFDHQPAHSPYRASGPVFVRQSASQAASFVDTLPPVLQGRLLSLRAYDAEDLIVDAEVVEGGDAMEAVGRLFARGDVNYVHVHNARRGCYSCRVDRT